MTIFDFRLLLTNAAAFLNQKLLWVFMLLFSIALKSNARSDSTSIAKNLIYIEAPGIGGYGSLNYERLIPIHNKFNIGLRIGASTYNLRDFNAKFNPDIILPFAINGLYGNNHKVLFGVGQTVSSVIEINPMNMEPERKKGLHANVTIGYRYHKNDKGILLGCSYTPIIEFYSTFRHWAGFSIGYIFK